MVRNPVIVQKSINELLGSRLIRSVAKSESRKWLPKSPSYRAKFVARDLASPARIRITHQKRLPAFSLSQVNYTHELKMSPSCEQLNNSDPFSSPPLSYQSKLALDHDDAMPAVSLITMVFARLVHKKQKNDRLFGRR